MGDLLMLSKERVDENANCFVMCFGTCQCLFWPRKTGHNVGLSKGLWGTHVETSIPFHSQLTMVPPLSGVVWVIFIPKSSSSSLTNAGCRLKSLLHVDSSDPDCMGSGPCPDVDFLLKISAALECHISHSSDFPPEKTPLASAQPM